MILSRHLYDTDAPERRSRASNNPTLLYSWWCTIFSAVIIAVRLFGRYVRNEQLFREDKIMAWSIIPLFARMGFVHVVLIYGTNNVDVTGLTDPIKIDHRRIGSQMVLGARIFFALFIWMAKFTVAEFLRRLTDRYWKKGYERGLYCIRIFLVVTFIMVFIATLAECQPMSHYWQVVPDPGPRCRQGFAQLLTMGITDVITDVLLVAFPIPIIIRSSMPLGRKISLISLFSMSIILIGVTAARMPLVIDRKGLQQFRTVFASSEVLAATFVSNFIILGSFLRDRGLKKQKFRAQSTDNSLERGGSISRLPPQHCSSDEHLARSLGFRTKPELIEPSSNAPRPAPVADLDRLPSNTRQSINFNPTNWRFPDEELRIERSIGGPVARGSHGRSSMPALRQGRRVSWFDVGGLLDTSATVPSPTDSVITHDFAANPSRPTRAMSSQATSSRVSLTPARGTSRPLQRPESLEPPNQPSQQLRKPAIVLTEGHEHEETQSIPSPQVNLSTILSQSREGTLPLERTTTQASSETLPSQDANTSILPHQIASMNHHSPREANPTISDPGGLLSASSPRPTPSSP